MKFSVSAGKLAAALAQAAALTSDKVTKRLPIMGAVRLTAADGAVAVSSNNSDAQLVLIVPADVIEPGELVVDAAKLAALAAGFPAKADVAMAGEGPVATIRSGRSKFKLPMLPVADLPSLVLADETGRTVISHADAVALLRPTFAISKEQTRYYLNGILLRSDGSRLTAVATDGHRLARVTIGSAGSFSQDNGCIVPLPTVKIIAKLLTTHRDVAEILLRRSASLAAIEAPGHFTLTSKLIDAVYPAWERAISSGGGGNNTVAINRIDLLAALERIRAVAGADVVASLAWGGELDGLHLRAPSHGDVAHDVVATQDLRGAGRIAFKAAHGTDLLEELDGDAVTLDAGDRDGVPIWINGGDADRFLIVQMPCRVAAEAAA